MPDGYEVQYGLNPLVKDANGDLDQDGLGNIYEYQYSLTNTVILYPNNPFSTTNTVSDYFLTTSQHRNRFYYDHIDRLIGAEYDNGQAIQYKYDGNGNMVRQVYLTRGSDTNGVPALWKYINGLTNAVANNGSFGDADGDKWSNYQEWMAGSNPLDANSKPDVLGLSGKNLATLQLPFVPLNFVIENGDINGEGIEEIVVGADGDPNGSTNSLLILSPTSSGWNTQRVDLGPFGITSLAIGQPTNREIPAIYVGLRQPGGTGRVAEVRYYGGNWQTNILA
jgi:YD repeat-containing protein